MNTSSLPDSNAPSNARALPDRPDIEQLKRQAKELLTASKAGEPTAVARLAGTPQPKLSDAQFVLAREHGFASWVKLRQALASADNRPVPRRANVSDAFAQPSTFQAATFLAAARRNGWEPGRLPTAIVFVFQNTFARRLADDPRFVEDPSMAVGNGRYFITVDDPAIAVSCISPGGAFVGQVENQTALGGASEFVLLNLAGGLGPAVTTGEIAIIESAVRDDGISHRYLPPGDVVRADRDLTDRLIASARTIQAEAHAHFSWTNPATFRQTQSEIDHYVAEGVTVVESEIASLLAVAEALGAAAAAAVVVSGFNGEDAHAPNWAELAETHWSLFEATLQVLSHR